MTSEGQAWALSQLEEIAQASDGILEIVAVVPPAASRQALKVLISLDCSTYPRAPDGLELRPREKLTLIIPADFPLDRPDLEFTHDRFSGAPHVQWGRHICLFQAPESEWQPGDGMFGFMQRVDDWLKAGAAGALDPIGLPLHPPAVYTTSSLLVIPRVNTPTPEPPWWAGYAEVTQENDACITLGQWFAYNAEPPATRLAPAILLPTDMPFEYPASITALKTVLAARGVPLDIVRLLLTLGALRNIAGQPLLFVLGAAMRGIAGGERKQHLACWSIGAERTAQLRAAALAADDNNKIEVETFDTWAESAKIQWCPVHDERPEIVVPRDSNTPMAWWRGRHVAILGCGAIGSAAAMLLCRAGAAKFQLYDNRIVTPGILVRQLFDRKQLGQSKAAATRFNIRYTNPDMEATPIVDNIVSVLRNEEQTATLLQADVIINATASTQVAAALEQRFRDAPKRYPPIISIVVGHEADQALMTFAVNGVPGVTVDLDRRVKLALANASNGRNFLDEFWPITRNRNRLFQPEPGCSDPTFRGSAADVLALTSTSLNVASRWLAENNSTQVRAFALRLLHTDERAGLPNQLVYAWPADRVLTERRRGYQIRLDQAAENALLGWMRRSERLYGRKVETGGVLFGQIDEFLKVIWISEVSGPPPDSLASHDGFVCGVAGVAALNTEKQKRTRGTVSFIGMWHTHPGAAPIPSCIDRSAMRELLNQRDFTARNFLMLIIGGSSDAPQIAGSLFDRADR